MAMAAALVAGALRRGRAGGARNVAGEALRRLVSSPPLSLPSLRVRSVHLGRRLTGGRTVGEPKSARQASCGEMLARTSRGSLPAGGCIDSLISDSEAASRFDHHCIDQPRRRPNPPASAVLRPETLISQRDK
jgi:hypothetical protein